jgi:hypothetical protein
MMKRRTAIRNVIFFSAGAVLLPSCVQQGDSNASIALKNIQVSGKQEKLLAELSESILPISTTAGSTQLAPHQFVLMMVDDCLKKEDQDKFIKALRGFNEFAKTKTGDAFTGSDVVKRKQLLTAIESKIDIPEDILSFYEIAKRLTVQSFTGSKYYLTEVRKYEMVPSRFHGCFPVAAKL